MIYHTKHRFQLNCSPQTKQEQIHEYEIQTMPIAHGCKWRKIFLLNIFEVISDESKLFNKNPIKTHTRIKEIHAF